LPEREVSSHPLLLHAGRRPATSILRGCQVKRRMSSDGQSIAQDNEIEMKAHFIFLSSFPAMLCFVAYYNS
jgi:hypothetical protein